jgi:hypothetical protein
MGRVQRAALECAPSVAVVAVVDPAPAARAGVQRVATHATVDELLAAGGFDARAGDDDVRDLRHRRAHLPR